MKNAFGWVEIPVTDFERAKKFYGTIYDAEIQVMDMEGSPYGMLPYDMENQGVGGGIVKMDGFKPSQEGVLVYINGGEDLATPLSKVEAAGGEIIIPKTNIGENGFMAHIVDTEGNRIALHSMK